MIRTAVAGAGLVLLVACSSSTSSTSTQQISTESAPVNSPAQNPISISYGDGPSQFGQLWLPKNDFAGLATAPPIVVLIHGGFWRSAYGLDLMDPLAMDLIARGFAVWNIEYRRVGQPGGGYPGTLHDVATAIDSLATIATNYPVNVSSVVIVGHSAGGHLALWAAGRSALAAGQPGSAPVVLARLGIGQGPVFDLRAGDAEGLGGGAVTDFIGGTFDQFPDRYAVATPSTTSGVALAVVRGVDDDIVPERFTVPKPVGSVVTVDVPGDHFALIDPGSQAWQAVIDLIAR